ncbi:MAG TPA: hypothetical protein ENH91_05575 [Leeuwenhoekiella sp.]|nr:hypothetical protein [Leeuwenhoekiella sp.]
MKQLNPFIFTFLSVFLFLSCDNEPIDFTERAAPEPIPEADLIVGEWDLTEVLLSDATASFDAGGIPVTAPVTGSGSNYDLQLIFTEDNAFTATGSYLQNVNLTLGPQTYDEQQEVKASDFLNMGSWSRTATLLTIDNGTEVQEITILELDENTLELQLTITQMQTIQDIPATITGTVTLNFERSN